jgi:hypothetical protein
MRIAPKSSYFRIRKTIGENTVSIEKYQSKQEALAALGRAKNLIQKTKVEAKQISKRALDTGITVGSAYLVGKVRAAKGEGAEKRILIPGTDIDAELAIGSLAALAGISGLLDEMSDPVRSFGDGLLAANAAIMGFTKG